MSRPSAPQPRASRGRHSLTRAAFAFLMSRVISKIIGPQQEHRRQQFRIVPRSPGHTVFLGDSISEFGLWGEWFPQARTLNRGVAGETSAQVLTRIDSAVVDPTAVLLLIGTNDLSAGIATSEIAQNVAAILRRIEQSAPGTPVWVQSVMPRTAAYTSELTALNDLLRLSCDRLPAHIQYLDLWPALADTQGLLRADFTLDKLHLNGDGYRAWVNLLRDAVPALRA